MIGLSTTPLCTLLLADHTNDQGDGTVTISMADGMVVSCQPDGSLQFRPDGTNGPWERCVIDGPLATFNPDGVHGYRFSIAMKVPNA